MAVWENAIITNKGLALLAKLSNGNTLSLVRAVAGAGFVDPAALKYQTEVSDVRQDLAFATQSYPEEGKCAVPVKLTNSGVSAAYPAKQIGIMAFDPDEGDILFMIAQETSGKGTDIPAEKEMPGFSAAWTFYLQYGQADGVEVAVDPSNTVTSAEVQTLIEGHNTEKNPHAGVLATSGELSSHANNQNNPHNVTAAQLGLDKVANTADSEKNVAFASEAGTARKVQYGVIIRFNGGRTEGTNMWTYDGSTSRSINITPEKIGAATADHGHTAADVGALPASGGKMTGAITLKGVYLTEGVDYGDEFPSTAPKGKLFLKRVVV